MNLSFAVVGVVIIHTEPVTAEEYVTGFTLTLTCNVTTTDQFPNITWFNDGNVIIDNINRITIEDDREQSEDNSTLFVTSTLTISDLELSDSGTYTCHASVDTAYTEEQISIVTVNSMLH